MKAVMISIKPKWVEKIASGEKTVEVRKTAPKIETPFKCFIYMTQGKLKELGDYSRWIYENRMKVIGEFVCDKIYNFVQAGMGIMFADENLNQLEPQEARHMTCLTDKEFEDYLGYKDGYGWHISDLKIYDKPKELSEFVTKRKCDSCKVSGYESTACIWDEDCIVPHKLSRAPQSWCYVEIPRL